MQQEITEIQELIKQKSAFVTRLTGEISQVIVGQKYLIDRLLIGLLADGHILIEGVPGLAKTLSVKTLSDAIQTGFQRIQFTPDLLPGDLVGTLIYNVKDGKFSVRKGPIFSNLILADEINRAPAKVQSALLEAMQERQVTIGDETFKLPNPFLVLATQNPIEQEGTYPLPEAQVDRFMLKLKVTYPTPDEELLIQERMTSGAVVKVGKVTTPAEILEARSAMKQIYIDDKVKKYIVDIVCATREPKKYGLDLEDLINYGASPRASIYLNLAAKAHAFIRGRAYVTPDDVKIIGPDVLRHRIILSYEAEAEELTSDEIIAKIFNGVEVP
ncbi:MAG: ATPase [candidate division Zixibacteria bacterium RBG_16_53_22]|nr:MAG: ATPase [candidate division Zixibacteria bacterium RBG_16_53_22]